MLPKQVSNSYIKVLSPKPTDLLVVKSGACCLPWMKNNLITILPGSCTLLEHLAWYALGFIAVVSYSSQFIYIGIVEPNGHTGTPTNFSGPVLTHAKWRWFQEPLPYLLLDLGKCWVCFSWQRCHGSWKCRIWYLYMIRCFNLWVHCNVIYGL